MEEAAIELSAWLSCSVTILTPTEPNPAEVGFRKEPSCPVARSRPIEMKKSMVKSGNEPELHCLPQSSTPSSLASNAPPPYGNVIKDQPGNVSSSVDEDIPQYPLGDERCVHWRMDDQKGRWKIHLAECFLDDSVSSAVCWCHWCFLTRLAHEVNLGDCCECSVALLGWMPGINCCALAVLRNSLRRRKRIRGNCFWDVLDSFFCPCCTLAQSLIEKGGVRVQTGLSWGGPCNDASVHVCTPFRITAASLLALKEFC